MPSMHVPFVLSHAIPTEMRHHVLAHRLTRIRVKFRKDSRSGDIQLGHASKIVSIARFANDLLHVSINLAANHGHDLSSPLPRETRDLALPKLLVDCCPS